MLPVPRQVKAIEGHFGARRLDIDIEIIADEPAAKVEAGRRKSCVLGDIDHRSAGLEVAEGAILNAHMPHGRGVA